jgi:hypothetical protein
LISPRSRDPEREKKGKTSLRDGVIKGYKNRPGTHNVREIHQKGKQYHREIHATGPL